MLDAVRSYANALIHRAREESQVAAQHAAYYVALTQEAELKLRGAEQVATLASLDEELHNIRAALTWSLAHAPEQALRIGSGLFLFWSYRAYFTEGHRWLSQALADPPPAPPADLAKAWRVRGVLAWYQNDYPSAMADYERSRELFVAAADPAGLIGVLNSIALVYQEQGDIPQAMSTFEAARARLAELDEASPPRQHLTAVIEHNLGSLYQEQGRLAEAAACYATAIAIHRANENIGYVQSTLNNLGVIAEASGEYDRARQYYEESLKYSYELESTFDVADCLYNLGNVAMAEGADDEAAAKFAEALPMAESMGSQRLQTKVLQSQGALARLHGQPEVAGELLARALELAQGIGEVRDTAEVWLELAMLANDQRDAARAGECLHNAAALSRQVHDQLALTVCLEEWAILCAHSGRADEGRRYAAAAAGLRQRLGSRPSPREHRRLIAALPAEPDAPAAAPEDSATLIDALLAAGDGGSAQDR
jgi:tetratricopeptide (TPR) repeat protein